jgi:hypothetical protein
MKQLKCYLPCVQVAWLAGAMITVPISISSPYHSQDSDASSLGRSPKVSSDVGKITTREKLIRLVVFVVTVMKLKSVVSGFGGLEVACWPVVAGSRTDEVVVFLGRKNPQHAFLRRGSKAVGPMS